MNNLKRVFSLALAGAMLAGMMVMGASAADFTDADKIVNTEAVDVAVALKIINGKDDGSYFDPEDLVTRGEMAKMIAIAVNGGQEPNTGVKTNPTYTDIKGHWAEQFIEYCSDMKYINGRGDGTFDPAGNVTGIEAAKMVLTALGYDAKAYQLTGADWAINTNFIATRTCDTSLYENMAGVAMNNPLSRDNAAQMIWNGLQNFVVDYNPDVSITGGDLSYGYKKSTTTKLLGQAYGGKIWVGTFDGNYDFHAASATKAGQIVVYGKADGAAANVSASNANVPSDLPISYIGEEVRVIYKDGKGGYDNRPDEKDTIYGVFLTGKTDVVTGTMADFGDNKTKDDKKIKFDGVKYDVAKSVTVYENFVGNGTVYSGGGNSEGGNHVYRADDDANSDLTAYLKKTSGATVKMTFNGNNEVENIYVTKSKIARVTAVSSAKVTMNNSVGSVSVSGNDIYKDVKKDDIVIVTTLYDADASKDAAFTTVVKAEPVNGVISAYEGTSGSKTENLTMDGKTYKVDHFANGGDKLFPEVVSSADGKDWLKDADLGEEFDLYLINGYAVAAVQLSEANSNYSVIISKNTTGADKVGVAIDGAKAEVMTSDGSKVVLTLNSDSVDYVANAVDGVKITKADQYKVGDIVTYSVDKNGYAKLERRAAYNTTGADTVNYKSGTKVVLVGGTTYNTTSDCVVYMDIDSSEGINWKAYKLRDLKTFTYGTGTNYTCVFNDSKELAALVLTGSTVGSRPSGATSNTVYGIVSSAVKNVKKDGKAYKYVTVQSNGDEYEVYTNEIIAKGDIVCLEVTSDDIYGSDELSVINTYKYISENEKAIAGYVLNYRESDKTITVSKTYSANSADASDKTYKVNDDAEIIGTYALTKDTEYYYVDRDGNKGVDSASIATMDSLKHTMNVIVIADPDSGNGYEAAVVIFETSNEAEIVKDIDFWGANGWGFKAPSGD